MAMDDRIRALAQRAGEELKVRTAGVVKSSDGSVTDIIVLLQSEYDAMPTPRPATTIYHTIPG